MLEKLYSTKMSEDQKSLQRRFSKIRKKSGKREKTVAVILYVVLIISVFITSSIVGSRLGVRDYSLSDAEYSALLESQLGAVMADIYYADSQKILVHYGSALFILGTNPPPENPMLSSEFDFVINLEKLNISKNQQGSNILEVKVDKDGKNAYLYSVGPIDEIKGFDEYILSLETGSVKKGSAPDDTEYFNGRADSSTTLVNPFGWFSNSCVIDGDKIYYLTCENGKAEGIQLVTVNHLTGETSSRFIFNPASADISFFAPQDIKDITEARLISGDIDIVIKNEVKLSKIEEMLSSAEIVHGGTGCSFTADLILKRADGTSGKVTLATDSCAVYKCGNTYYDYSDGDNSHMFDLLGVTHDRIINNNRR